jgi:hypothetical protein
MSTMFFRGHQQTVNPATLDKINIMANSVWAAVPAIQLAHGCQQSSTIPVSDLHWPVLISTSLAVNVIPVAVIPGYQLLVQPVMENHPTISALTATNATARVIGMQHFPILDFPWVEHMPTWPALNAIMVVVTVVFLRHVHLVIPNRPIISAQTAHNATTPAIGMRPSITRVVAMEIAPIIGMPLVQTVIHPAILHIRAPNAMTAINLVTKV